MTDTPAPRPAPRSALTTARAQAAQAVQSGHARTASGHRAPPGRLLGVDVLRALAVLGMVWMHFHITGVLEPASEGQPPAAALEWLNGLFDTRSRAVFFLLAGVSVALLTGGSAPYTGRTMRTARQRIAVRAGVLLVLGLCLEQVSGNPNIITAYAGWLLFLIPWARLRARTLFTAAGAFAVASPVFRISAANQGQDWWFMPEAGPGAPQNAEGLWLVIHPEDWFDVFHGYVFAPDTFFALPLLLAGLAIGRLDLRSRAVRVRLVLAGAVTAIGACAVSWLALHPLGASAALDRHEAAMAAAPAKLPRMPWEQLWALAHPGRGIAHFSALEPVLMTGVSLALIGGLLLLTERSGGRRALWPLAATGGMALTWYCVQDFVSARVLGDGDQQLGNAPQSLTPFLIFVAAVLAVSVAWRLYFRRGPLEGLVHRVTAKAVTATGR